MVERLTEWSYLAGVMTGDLKVGADERKAFDRLAAYEDTGLEPEGINRIIDVYGRGLTLRTDVGERLEIIKDIQTERLKQLAQAEKDGRLVVLSPNEPLTPDEMREMDGEPVWISSKGINRYDICCKVTTDNMVQFYTVALPGLGYDKTWLAYRRKPEEGTA